MRSARLRDWIIGMKAALEKDPALEERLSELDKLITQARVELSNRGVPPEHKVWALVDTFGEVSREVLVGAIYTNPTAALPFFKRALIHVRKLINKSH